MWPLTTADSLYLVVCPGGPSLERFLKSERILREKSGKLEARKLGFSL